MDAEQTAADIRNALKAAGGRGEPDAQLVDRLLIINLHGQAIALRKAATRVQYTDARDTLRDLADETDPFLR